MTRARARGTDEKEYTRGHAKLEVLYCPKHSMHLLVHNMLQVC